MPPATARRVHPQSRGRDFRQQLSHQAASRRPESRADGELFPPLLPAREQRARHVDARHQQHKGDGAEQHQQRLSRTTRERLVQRHRGHANGIASPSVSGTDPGSNRVELGGGLACRDPVAKPRHHLVAVTGARRRIFEELFRHPEVGRCRVGESGRHHANDTTREALNLDTHRWQVGIGAERLRPERVTDHRRRDAADSLFLRRKSPPRHRPDSEHVEEAVGDVIDVSKHRLRTADDHGPSALRGGHRRKPGGLLAPIEKIRKRHGDARPAPGLLPYPDDPIRVGYGSGRRSTPLTTLKMAVSAPMPTARVSTEMAVNPGLFSSIRNAWRKS